MTSEVQAGDVASRLTFRRRLTIALSKGEHDITVVAPGNARVADLNEELSAAIDGSLASRTLRVERNGLRLEPTALLVTADLRDGDRLLVDGDRNAAATAAERTSAPGPVLVVTGGPRAGEHADLPSSGVVVVGRDPRASDIVVADPALSARHLQIDLTENPATLTDLGSTNGTWLNGERLTPNTAHPFSPGTLIEAGRSSITIEVANDSAPGSATTVDGAVLFNRPPRLVRPYRPATIEIAAPPPDPRPTHVSWTAIVLPLLVGVVLFLVTREPATLLFVVLSPLMLVARAVEERVTGSRGFAREAARYRTQLDAAANQLEAALEDEQRHRRAAAPDARDVLNRALSLRADLWDRRRQDQDFLAVRLGATDQPAAVAVSIAPGGSENLRREGAAQLERRRTVPLAPVVVNLAQTGSLGLTGLPESVDAAARWVVLQSAVLHSPRELRVAAIIGNERLPRWEWLKWLPHTDSEGTGLPRLLATDGGRARHLLEGLENLVGRRIATGSPRTAGDDPFMLLIADEDVPVDRSLLDRVLLAAAGGGIAVLWLGSDETSLPGGIGTVARLHPDIARFDLVDIPSGRTLTNCSRDGVSLQLAQRVARALASVRDVSADAAADLPAEVPLLQLLGDDATSVEATAERWRDDGDVGSVPIGIGTAGIVELHLTRDGPHGLVAGTTGSGKSEFLRSLVAALAHAHPHTRINFLLVDYKGGAAFASCVGLPHTVGLVSDLEPHMTARALSSLNAELRYRERVLRDADVDELGDMLVRDPQRAPARLLIVVDEFAALVRETPAFIDELVNIARRGRSLGMHLLLATQTPAGVVSSHIAQNTDLRVAFRLNDATESQNIVDTLDATRIDSQTPGRGFMKVGNERLQEFQAAYAGARSSPFEKSLAVMPFTFLSIGDEHSDNTDRASPTHLEELVDTIRRAAERAALPAARRPWLPPLPSAISLRSLVESQDKPAVAAPFALLDAPDRQAQEPLRFDLSTDNTLLVFGTAMSGKTTLLRTLATSLALQTRADRLHIYALDFGLRGLDPIARLPHCGSVIPGEDEERVRRLFAFLTAEVSRRRTAFAHQGVLSIGDLERRGDEPPPRILVLLDGLGTFLNMYQRVGAGELVDGLPRLVTEGSAAGVHFILTADRRAAVPGALTALMPNRLMLRLASQDEYSLAGLNLRAVPVEKLPPGRGFTGRGEEFQVAVVGDDADGLAQSEAVARIGEQLPPPAPAHAPRPIGHLPVHVSLDSLGRPAAPGLAAIGVADATLASAIVSIADGHFLIAGPYRSGRTTCLATLTRSLVGASPGLRLHLLAPRRTRLSDLPGWASVSRGVEQCEQRIKALGRHLAELGGSDVVVIDDGDELLESAGETVLTALVRTGRDTGLRVIAASEAKAALRSYASWLTELRKDQHGVLLTPDHDLDGSLLGAHLPRSAGGAMPPGRGYLVLRGSVELIQVALPE